ncbi:hypothetical protein F183_A21870 [Bryobacterales bacterium F-183]|nr:hypothetical protein F183_A21870 [Bryobacterales bacterium F-183]
MSDATGRWAKIDACLGEALDIESPSEREAFLVSQLTGDPEALAEARRLLSQADTAYEVFDRSPVADLAGLKEGARLGPWQLVKQLGSGGMGVVWMARRVDGQAEMLAAIKLLPPAFRNADLEQRFQVEKQILARLEHPGIARLLDAGTGGGGDTPNFVMEYVDGQSLTDYIAQERLPLAARLRLFLRICDAVQYAHSNLVIHRDLKPHNILVNAKSEPKLLDFGIGKIVNEAQQNATLHRAFSLDYASPEQIRGAAIGTAADVYALGLILYEMLTGEPARRWGSLALGEVLDRADRFELPPMEDRDLTEVCRKATAVDPTMRYRTVAEFAADVERRAEGRPVEARPVSQLYRAYCFARRNRVGVASASVAVALILGLTVWGWVSAQRAASERAVAVEKTVALQSALLRESEALKKEVEARSTAEARRLEAQRQTEFAQSMQALAAQRELQAEERMRSLLRLYQASMGSAVQSVARLSGGTAASIAWMESALQRLSELKPSEAGRPAYLAMQAETHVNLASLYGGSNSNLGQKEKYESHLRRSLELWSEAHRLAPNNHEWTRGYLSARFSVVRLDKAKFEKGKPLPEVWLKTLQDFTALAAVFPPATRIVGDYYFWRATYQPEVAASVADYRSSLAWFQKTLDEAKPTMLALRDNALLHKYLADSRTLALEERLQHAAEAIRLDTRRVQLDPDNAASKLDLAFSIAVGAGLAHQKGDYRDSLAKFREAFTIRRDLARNDRQNAFLVRSLWFPLRWYGQTAYKLGDWETLRVAIREYELLIREVDPAYRSLTDDVGYVVFQAFVAEHDGSSDKACTLLNQALAMQKTNTATQRTWYSLDDLMEEITQRKCQVAK